MAGKEAATQFDDEQIIEIEIERLRSFKDVHYGTTTAGKEKIWIRN